jgi:hypothetical protein
MVNVMRVSRLFIVAAASALIATPALAQAPPATVSEEPAPPVRGERPFRGIFGGGMGDTEQSLTVSGAVGGGWESDYLQGLLLDANGQRARGRTGGGTGVGSASLSYTLGRERASVNASLDASAFYYPDAVSELLHSRRASASQRLQVTEGLVIRGGQYVSYQPFRLDRLFPGAGSFSFGAPADLPLDTFAGTDEYLDHGADVDISQQITRRVSLGGGYSYASSGAETRRYTLQGGRVGVGIAAGRGVSLRLGYGHYQGRLIGEDESRIVRHHNVDVGVDYSGAISLSRRTSLSFSTGSTAVRDRQRTHFRVIGHASLDREIGRSWRANLAYSRNVHFIDQLGDVVFADSLLFSVGGLVSRRVSFHSGVGATKGEVGFASSRNGGHATYAGAGLVTALGRMAAVGVDYNYYLHSFGADVSLPGGVIREIDRHSVRAYLSVWAPLVARVRSQNASR